MSAGKYNFTIEQGTTVIKQFTYKDSAGTVVDLSNYSASMQVKEDYTSSVIISLSGSASSSTSSQGLAIIAPSGSTTKGQVQLTIDATTTADFNFVSALYDLEIKNSSTGAVTRLLQGSIGLSKEITKI
mgnify:CR=1 FL=1